MRWKYYSVIIPSHKVESFHCVQNSYHRQVANRGWPTLKRAFDWCNFATRINQCRPPTPSSWFRFFGWPTLPSFGRVGFLTSFREKSNFPALGKPRGIGHPQLQLRLKCPANREIALAVPRGRGSPWAFTVNGTERPLQKRLTQFVRSCKRPPLANRFLRARRQLSGRLQSLWKEALMLSSRVKRGICFLSNRRKKADSSGKPALRFTENVLRERNDTLRVFPQPVESALL